MQVLLLNGPNLNLLGTREPEKYGTQTLKDIETFLVEQASKLKDSKGNSIQVNSFQSNHEGEMIDIIHSSRGKVDAIIINAGAWTHTSVAIRDALSGVVIPFVEVHISNVHAREPFRHHSYLSDIASGVIVGLGTYGYTAALEFCSRMKLPSK